MTLRFRNLIAILLLTFFIPTNSPAAQPRISLSQDGQGFMLAESGRKFVPWGLNYDHDSEGRLLEDYWDKEWESVEGDFAEMKQLGCNVVRVHLQFGRFMNAANEPNQNALDKLAELIDLAERTGLYLNLTGLGCYHKQDVPGWYNDMTTEQRWQAQANFWSAIAEVCSSKDAVFCYDLMNEPVVHGGDGNREDWLGPGFAGKHFVQFICRDRGGKTRHQLAEEWTKAMVAAVRKHDSQHLITIGLVPWSLDRPGLTSGFDPKVVAPHLDFISVHIYPESNKLAEALEILKGFDEAGKPVVIEEMFPLKCDAQTLGDFTDQSKPIAEGWFGFYWGRTAEQLRAENTIPTAITASWLELFQEKANQITSLPAPVQCEGDYPKHLQGICIGPDDSIFWSFTTKLVKTDATGNLLKVVDVEDHHGDLCSHDGKIYVAVNLGKFNDPAGNADSWVYVYDANNLELLNKHAVPEVFHGAGGIGIVDDRFYVVGGLPDQINENYVYEYDSEFNFQKKHVIESGHTHLGIQTAAFANGKWWFGCYGDPKTLIVTDKDFSVVGRYEFDCSLGIADRNGNVWTASGTCRSNIGCNGMIQVAVEDSVSGLKVYNAREQGF